MIKTVKFTMCGRRCAPPAVSVLSIHYSSFLSPGPPGRHTIPPKFFAGESQALSGRLQGRRESVFQERPTVTSHKSHTTALLERNLGRRLKGIRVLHIPNLIIIRG